MKTSLTQLRSVLFALLVVAGLASCKKDGENINPDLIDNNPAFVGKKWQLSSFILDPAIDLDGDGTPDPDLLEYLPACSKDDIIIFKADGKMGGEPGVLCDDETPGGSGSGSWTYDKNSKILKIIGSDGPTDVDELQVVEMSASTLKAKVEVTEEGTTLTAYMTFKAK